MTFWLVLSAPLEAPTGVNAALYRQMIAAAPNVADRVTRCFAGPAWLKRQFTAHSFVKMHLLTHADASVGVEDLTATNDPDDDNGPVEVSCRLYIPTFWLTKPGDGLLSLRLFQAVLHALHTIGDRYSIGTPAAIGPTADRGDPEVWDPFRPPPPLPSYADINARLERLAAAVHPDQLLVTTREPTLSTDAEQCRSAREALGTVVDQHTLTAPNVKATAWIIQTRS